jgi:hypothetical protein
MTATEYPASRSKSLLNASILIRPSYPTCFKRLTNVTYSSFFFALFYKLTAGAVCLGIYQIGAITDSHQYCLIFIMDLIEDPQISFMGRRTVKEAAFLSSGSPESA